MFKQSLITYCHYPLQKLLQHRRGHWRRKSQGALPLRMQAESLIALIPSCWWYQIKPKGATTIFLHQLNTKKNIPAFVSNVYRQ